jgi:hypothetical protein
MLTSITPLGERGRGNRYALTAGAYLFGSVLGGATTGAVLGTVGAVVAAPLPGPVRLLLAALACALAAGADAVALRTGWRLPGGRRQVDEDWLTRYRGWVYGGAFGFQLGLGVVTIVTSAATFALLALVVLTGGPGPGLVLGAVFGLVRALPLLGLRRVHTPDALRTAARAVVTRSRAAARGVVAVLGTAAAVLAAGAVTA